MSAGVGGSSGQQKQQNGTQPQCVLASIRILQFSGP